MNWSKFLGFVPGRDVRLRDKIIAIGVPSGAVVVMVVALFVFDHYDCSTIVPDIAEVCRKLPWHGMNLENQAVVFHVKPPSSTTHFESYSVTPRIYLASDPAKVANVLPKSSNLEYLENGWTRPPTFSSYMDAGRWQVAIAIDTVVGQGNSTRHAIYNAEPSFFVEPVQNFHNFLIAIGTFAGFSITGGAILFQIFYSRKQNTIAQAALDHERETRWKDWYRAHSELIANELSSHWGRDSPIFAYHTTQFSEFQSFDGVEPKSQYSDAARPHLEKGYPDLWNLFLESRDEAKRIVTNIDSALEKYKAVVVNFIETRCELRRSQTYESEQDCFYHDQGLFLRTIDEIRNQVVRNRKPQASRIQPTRRGIHDFYTVNIGSYSIAQGDEEQATKLVDAINDLYDQKDVIDSASAYLEQLGNLKNNETIGKYESRLNEVISDIQGGLPAEGPKSCQMCRKMHEYIFNSRSIT